MAKRKNKFIHRPVYPGGMKALNQFLRDNLRYPPKALENKTEGTVKVAYSLNQAGKVIKAAATEGPGDGCREEAVRLVKSLRFQVPKDYKRTVQYHQNLKINFKLPTTPTPKNSSQVQYTMIKKNTTSQEKPRERKEANEGGYSYTIEW